MPSLVVEACSVLGIEPGEKGTPPASDAIQSAFKKLAIKWHPDRNPDNVKAFTKHGKAANKVETLPVADKGWFKCLS